MSRDSELQRINALLRINMHGEVCARKDTTTLTARGKHFVYHEEREENCLSKETVADVQIVTYLEPDDSSYVSEPQCLCNSVLV